MVSRIFTFRLSQADLNPLLSKVLDHLMATSTESQALTESYLPEAVPIDGSGNEKRYVSSEEARERKGLRHPNREPENLLADAVSTTNK